MFSFGPRARGHLDGQTSPMANGARSSPRAHRCGIALGRQRANKCSAMQPVDTGKGVGPGMCALKPHAECNIGLVRVPVVHIPESSIPSVAPAKVVSGALLVFKPTQR